MMGVKRWRKKAEDRSEWAVILKEVLVKIYPIKKKKKNKKKKT